MTEKVVIPTAKVRKMAVQPYLRVEAPEQSTGWGRREHYSYEEQKAALAEIQRSIARHVDGLGQMMLVAPEVLVCQWCDNPADDCEQDGPEAGVPLCCDEAVAEYDQKYRTLTKD